MFLWGRHSVSNRIQCRPQVRNRSAEWRICPFIKRFANVEEIGDLSFRSPLAVGGFAFLGAFCPRRRFWRLDGERAMPIGPYEEKENCSHPDNYENWHH